MGVNNSVKLIGRLTSNPRCEDSHADKPFRIARFNVAADRDGKDKGADFPGCVAMGKTAEFVEKWFKKGTPIVVDGSIRTGSYTNRSGDKVYTTEVFAEKANFVPRDKRADDAQASSDGSNVANTTRQDESADGFMNIPDGVPGELPFT